MAISEESLEEYRKLYVLMFILQQLNDLHALFACLSKASASVLAIDERQSLETLTREEKTASRLFAQLSEKQQGLEEKRETLAEDARVQAVRKTEVRALCSSSGKFGY
jgi:structural maintenance of chromosome 1